jgi:hypothetical protein
MSEKDERAASDELERSLARTMSWALPGATVLGAILVGLLFGIGPAILVLAAGALVGVIGLLWASLRTLGGDAPLAEGLATAVAMREDVRGGAEAKRRVLRALKDLDHEHSVGKIDDDDYALMSARYRDQAKEILRDMDVALEPLRARAEALARTHLARKGVAGSISGEVPSGLKPLLEDREVPAAPRVPCSKCATANEPDAEFCKKCGGRLARIPCPACPTSNEPDATFCKKCGTALSAVGRERESGATDATS